MAIRKETTIHQIVRQRQAGEEIEVARERRLDLVEELYRTHGAPYAIAALGVGWQSPTAKRRWK